jgi:hypothetical protein
VEKPTVVFTRFPIQKFGQDHSTLVVSERVREVCESAPPNYKPVFVDMPLDYDMMRPALRHAIKANPDTVAIICLAVTPRGKQMIMETEALPERYHPVEGRIVDDATHRDLIDPNITTPLACSIPTADIVTASNKRGWPMRLRNPHQKRHPTTANGALQAACVVGAEVGNGQMQVGLLNLLVSRETACHVNLHPEAGQPAHLEMASLEPEVQAQAVLLTARLTVESALGR